MIEILLSLLVTFTGIPRTVDPGLTAIAQRRSQEIVTDFSHAGMDPRYYEVLSLNESGPERAVEQWIASPSHAAIITDPSLTSIGCGVTQDGAVFYFACVLSAGAAPAPEPTPPADGSTQSTDVDEPPPPVTVLPDAAMVP